MTIKFVALLFTKTKLHCYRWNPLAIGQVMKFENHFRIGQLFFG